MTERPQPDARWQARITTAEAAHKKSEAELALLRPQAASLEQQLSESQVKLKAAQADVTNLRAEALRNKVSFQPIKNMSMQMPHACVGDAVLCSKAAWHAAQQLHCARAGTGSRHTQV